MESSIDDKAGPVAIGAKGTIVSLMEKELQLHQESSKTIKLAAPQLQVRNEAVSVYCGNFASNARGNRSSPVMKSGSCTERSPGVIKTSCKDALGRSSSLRNSRSKGAKLFQFPSPKSGDAPRKKVVSYHNAASSGMLSFVSSSNNDALSRKSQLSAGSVDDHLLPILSPGRQKLPKLSSPSKFSVASPVQIADTRCYRGGRELFRPFPKSSTSPKKQLNFWRL
ncbi:hypothetical protein SELMODRAFT_428082 [Selaginella moellendorffii]|uniref:Uncharacterized protein n=1 Tax=Selaginella moellendorffii TaxID=88036 RepID=D8T1N6_SELML|nr:hypothetical protein SELMODRAFT_428082 [Selaginella moellendorffii]